MGSDRKLAGEERDVRECFCLNLRRSARQITSFYDERMRGSGLKTTQFQLLAAISEMVAEAGPAAQQPLADVLGVDRTTLTRNLALLKKEGLVWVGRARHDQRERAIQLTPAGRRKLAQATPLWHEAQAEIKARIAGKPGVPPFARILALVRQVGEASET